MDSASRTGRRASRRSRTTWACRPARWALFCVTLPLPALAGSLPALLGALALLGIASGSLDVSMNAQAVVIEQRYGRPTRTLALLGAIAFCGLLSEGAAYDWSSVYLRDSLGASEGLAVSAYAAFTFTMTVGRLVGDRLRARYGSRALLGS